MVGTLSECFRKQNIQWLENSTTKHIIFPSQIKSFYGSDPSRVKSFKNRYSSQVMTPIQVAKPILRKTTHQHATHENGVTFTRRPNSSYHDDARPWGEIFDNTVKLDLQMMKILYAICHFGTHEQWASCHAHELDTNYREIPLAFVFSSECAIAELKLPNPGIVSSAPHRASILVSAIFSQS